MIIKARMDWTVPPPAPTYRHILFFEDKVVLYVRSHDGFGVQAGNIALGRVRVGLLL
jgi:hypothetical protein